MNMARLGRINKLTIKTIRDYGALLAGGKSGDILLPGRDLPENCQPGEEIVVLVYKDAEDRLLATTRKPLVTVGRFASLRVVETTAAGAYLDWGVPRDLFVPKSEQLEQMATGGQYPVMVFVDGKTGRLLASSKLEKFLDRQPPNYAEGEEVELLIYDQSELGYKAVVNQAHAGMLYKNEVFQRLVVGQELTGYVKKVRADQKIDLSLKQPGYQAVKDVSQTIFEIIQARGGRIAVTDKSPPEEIYALFGVSKKSFKKAIGALYQKRLITIDPQGVSLVG